jgi:5-methylcytosine-specific restriction endonuclease McrA
MPGDPFYRTAQWIRLRRSALHRDNHTCVIPGCGLKAIVVDHITSRRNGGTDRLANLRSLCRYHDNQLKEFNGKRRNDKPSIKGSNEDGSPIDPKHPWHRVHQC